MIKIAGGNLTNDGKKIFLDRTYNTSPTRNEVMQFKAGIGTTAFGVTQTDLVTPVPHLGQEAVDACDATTGWSAGTDSSVALNNTTFQEGTGSLNLSKTGTSGVTGSMSKTTTSVDYTSKDLAFRIYILNQATLDKLETTDALTIRFGSDASNYYQFTKDKSDLSVGWNWINLGDSSAADSTTGSPTITACDYTLIQFTVTASATVTSAGDIIIDDIIVIEAGDFVKDFESGYPSLDFTTLQCEIRGKLNTLEALGFNVSEVGIFNDDGTPLMESRDTFTSISKSNTEEIIFIWKTIID